MFWCTFHFCAFYFFSNDLPSLSFLWASLNDMNKICQHLTDLQISTFLTHFFCCIISFTSPSTVKEKARGILQINTNLSKPWALWQSAEKFNVYLQAVTCSNWFFDILQFLKSFLCEFGSYSQNSWYRKIGFVCVCVCVCVKGGYPLWFMKESG